MTRVLFGLAACLAFGLTIALAAALFRGALTDTTPITVLAPRAGLVMNPDAKVKWNGVQVGRVRSIEYLQGGQAALHLELDPPQLGVIPENVHVDIASSTVFGAKFVQLVTPSDPSPQSLRTGQVLTADHVTVEVNTVFEQLTSVLSQIDPAKLNATLTAISSALSGRGEKIGQTIDALNSTLVKLDPSLPTLSHDLQAGPEVLNTFADVTPDLLSTADNAARLSETVVDKQHDLDALLLSATGFADVGNDVIGGNRGAISGLLRILVPTTDLLAEYQQAVYCSVAGLLELQSGPPLRDPGVEVNTGFLWGTERYRYPQDLPKVAASGGPQCTDMPKVPFNVRPPQVITDIGINPWRYDNPGIVLNSDGLKRLLFGPVDGPPRNTAQIGQPG